MNLWNKYFLRWNAEHMDATYTIHGSIHVFSILGIYH